MSAHQLGDARAALAAAEAAWAAAQRCVAEVAAQEEATMPLLGEISFPDTGYVLLHLRQQMDAARDVLRAAGVEKRAAEAAVRDLEAAITAPPVADDSSGGAAQVGDDS